MDTVKVVDAMMGRGKTSAAIRYMNENSKDRRFLFVTPYLSEVDRVCVCCDFEEPDDLVTTKSAKLKSLMRRGSNIAATHALFYLMDDEALRIASEERYSLIIDESIQMISQVRTSKSDMDIILGSFVTEDERGFLHWKNSEYTGRFYTYKELADSNSLLHLDTSLINVMDPKVLMSFEEVIILTYLFEGQYQHAYLQYFDIPYDKIGVTQDDRGYKFSDKPDVPPSVNYTDLINIACIKSGYAVGEKRTALSKSWYDSKGPNDSGIKIIRNSLDNFFNHKCAGDKDKRIWTSFKDSRDILTYPKGRYATSFIPLNEKATNKYRECTDVAYLANRFANPNIIKFFAQNGVSIDQDVFALSEMLQFVWRSAIRDNKPITLYMPSKRMRDLLFAWMDSVAKGGCSNVQGKM